MYIFRTVVRFGLKSTLLWIVSSYNMLGMLRCKMSDRTASVSSTISTTITKAFHIVYWKPCGANMDHTNRFVLYHEFAFQLLPIELSQIFSSCSLYLHSECLRFDFTCSQLFLAFRALTATFPHAPTSLLLRSRWKTLH